MDALEALLTRSSATYLSEPAPSREVLETIIQAASCAPDHGRLRPWRFVLIHGDRRDRFGEVLAACLARRQPQSSDLELRRERERAFRAPVVVVVAARTQRDHPKIPEIEQIIAAGAAAQNLTLAVHACGFGSMWKTGPAAYDPDVKTALGLAATDHIIGFLYVGTPAGPQPARKRPFPGDLVRDWQE